MKHITTWQVIFHLMPSLFPYQILVQMSQSTDNEHCNIYPKTKL